MKRRILVMNGQRIVENQEDGKWKTIKVTKAGSLKGGIYNIFMAKDADKTEKTEGILVHATKEELFLKTPYGFVRHELAENIKLPEFGAYISVSYENEKMLIQRESTKNIRKLTL